jgi:hypothetical protein
LSLATVGRALFEAPGVPRGGSFLLYPGLSTDIRFLSARTSSYDIVFLAGLSSGLGTSGAKPVGLTPPTWGCASGVSWFERSVAFVFILCDGAADPSLSTESRVAAAEVIVEDTVLWSETGWKEPARGISESWSSGTGLVAGDFSPGSENAGLITKSMQSFWFIRKESHESWYWGI